MLEDRYLKILFHFVARDAYLPPYDYLKLKNNANYLMTSEDTAEDLLKSVHFYIKSKVFFFRVTVHLLFSFSLQETLKSVFLPPYDPLKLNHVESDMTSKKEYLIF